MNRIVRLSVALGVAALAQAQGILPKPPFTAKDLEYGKQLVATSAEVRAQIKDGHAPAEPFKIIGNLYFVGMGSGEAYLLTSPQGHILFGAGWSDTVDQVQKNIEAMGFKMSDIKAILLNHNHVDQSGAAAELKRRTGAQLMAAHGEIPYIEHGQHSRPPIAAPPGQAPAKGGDGRGPTYPPARVDRALFDGDVIRVGPLSVTAYLSPGHSATSTSWLYTVRDGGRDYRVFEFCCWEFPDDLSQNSFITEASVRHTFETFRKVLPVDIYFELGTYGWGGVLNQPSGTITERLAKVRANPKLFINPQIFRGLSAARAVEFEEKIATLKSTKE
jgi:metallo-beta-lactamase class B